MRAKIAALAAAVAAAAGTAGAAVWARGRRDVEGIDLEVAEAPAGTAVAGTTEAVAPSPPEAQATHEAAGPREAAASPDAPDDLTAIKGLGKVKAAKLAAAGVTSYAQIAAWTEDDISAFGLETNTSPGQIKREDWVGQAQALTRR